MTKREFVERWVLARAPLEFDRDKTAKAVSDALSAWEAICQQISPDSTPKQSGYFDRLLER